MPKPFIDPTINFDRDLYPEDANARDGAALPDHIYMDSMGFGMGCSCLQLTFQATNINEARNLYDQLVPISPILLALTAASPAYRGYLSDQDTRWNVIAGSVDDRTEVERGLKPPPPDLKTDNSDFVIPKSRYDSIDSYLAINDPVLRGAESHYNDSKLVVNNKVLARLHEAGFDELLAKHFAHLFIRDPIVYMSRNCSNRTMRRTLTTLRISSRPTGRLCGSSRLLLAPLLAGESSSDPWRCSSLTLRMHRSQF